MIVNPFGTFVSALIIVPPRARRPNSRAEGIRRSATAP